MEHLPHNLKTLRTACNLSQRKIASKLFISYATYNYFETGKRTPPLEVLTRIAELHNVGLDKLVRGRIEEKPMC